MRKREKRDRLNRENYQQLSLFVNYLLSKYCVSSYFAVENRAVALRGTTQNSTTNGAKLYEKRIEYSYDMTIGINTNRNIYSL